MMSDEVIREKIDSFPSWHFAFDLNGNLTKKYSYRQVWRKEYFFDPLVELLGGSLEGKRVLDLACNAGYWSWCAIEAGCDYILGIDYEQMHIEQSTFVFEVKEVDKSRYDLIAGDIFATDLTQFGTFDVVLCPGLMYHITKPMELLEKISAVNSDLLMIDTRLADLPGSAISIRHGGRRMHPSREAVRDLAQQCGYSVRVLKPHFGGPGGVEHPSAKRLGDYRWPNRRGRRAFMCAKRTDLGHLPVETEPIELPKPRRPKPQRPKPQRPKPQRPEPSDADLAKPLLRRTDRALSELFVTRSWKLASALVAALQVLRRSRNPSPEDQLRELKGEFRALLRHAGRPGEARPSKRGSRTD
jgi:SAM-dependent methyltransferase